MRGQYRVTLDATGEGLWMASVKSCANPLPAGADEHVALDVDNGGRDADGIAEMLEQWFDFGAVQQILQRAGAPAGEWRGLTRNVVD